MHRVWGLNSSWVGIFILVSKPGFRVLYLTLTVSRSLCRLADANSKICEPQEKKKRNFLRQSSVGYRSGTRIRCKVLKTWQKTAIRCYTVYTFSVKGEEVYKKCVR